MKNKVIKSLLIICCNLLLPTYNIYSQKNITSNQIALNKEGLVIKKGTKKLFTGIVEYKEKKYPNRKYISKTETYLNGKLNGQTTVYSSENNIVRTENYLNGELNGKTVIYSSDGEIDYNKIYLDNNLIKEERFYNDVLLYEGNYENNLLKSIVIPSNFGNSGNQLEIIFNNGALFKPEIILMKNRDVKKTIFAGNSFAYLEDWCFTTGYFNGDVFKPEDRFIRIVGYDAFGQSYEIKESEQVNNNLFQVKYDLSFWENGTVKAYNNKGVLIYENNYKEQKKQGVQREYWSSNGKIMKQESYLNDSLNGLQQEWFENGQLKNETNYIDGKKNGARNEWYENGLLNFENYFIDDSLNGIEKVWYTNGKIKSESSYKKGKRVSYKLWFENGQLQEEADDFNYNPEGFCKIWFENGQLGKYINPKLGLHQEWDIEGRLIYENKVINGNGYSKKWHSYGHLKEEYLIKNGEIDGTYKSYYGDGQLHVYCTYKNGVLNGSYKSWRDKNVQLSDLMYVNGLETGWVKEIGDGMIYGEQHFKNGKLIREKNWNYEPEWDEEYLYETTEINFISNKTIECSFYKNGKLAQESIKTESNNGDTWSLKNYFKNGILSNDYYEIDGSVVKDNCYNAAGKKIKCVPNYVPTYNAVHF
jgi:antitoxin component YwqK of YwqJK toxin-antitoxin module